MHLISKDTLNSIQRYFEKKPFFIGFAVGALLTISAGIWGKSPIPVWTLSIASGFGWLLNVLLLTAIVLSVAALILRHRAGDLAYKGFKYTFQFTHPRLMRTVSVFSGVIATATVYWIATGSHNAILLTLYSLILCVELLWCWVCLAVIADELSKRLERPSNGTPNC